MKLIGVFSSTNLISSLLKSMQLVISESWLLFTLNILLTYIALGAIFLWFRKTLKELNNRIKKFKDQEELVANLTSTVQESGVPISWVDESGTIIYHNDPFSQLFAFVPNIFDKSGYSNLYPTVQGQAILESVTESEQWQGILELPKPTEQQPLIVKVHAVPFDGGCRFYHRDITAQKQLEDLSELLLDLDVAYADWQLNSQGATEKIILNKAHYDLLGIFPGSFSGNYKDYINLIYPDDRSGVQQRLYNAVTTKQSEFSLPFRVPLSGGKIQSLSAKAKIKYNEQGQPTKIRMIVTKDSQNVSVDQYLRDQIKFQLFMDTLSELVSQITEDGHFLFATRSHQKILGHEPHELTGTHVLTYVHQYFKPNTGRIFEDLVAHPGESRVVIHPTMHKLGHYVLIKTEGFNYLHIPYFNSIVATSVVLQERFDDFDNYEYWINYVSSPLT